MLIYWMNRKHNSLVTYFATMKFRILIYDLAATIR